MGLFGKSQLQKALERGAAQGDYTEALRKDVVPSGVEDAKAVGRALARLRLGPRMPGRIGSDLHVLTALFQDVQDEKTAAAMSQHALPELVAAFDRGLDAGADESDLLFVLKILALYGGSESRRRIIATARTHPGGYLWSVIFDELQKSPQEFHEVIDALRSPLPAGFASIAFLDACNSLARKGDLDSHPFDTPEGRGLLEQWLRGVETSYACSATAALPFVAREAREKLLELAAAHSDVSVQMEAAWAAASLGEPNAVARLIAWCERPQTCWRAQEYLKELGFEDQIPASSKTAEFQALTEMAGWLEHPNEFGEPPDEIVIADSRELHWPPTDDRRRVFAVRYLYKATADRESDDAGYGMVGSVTFALFGESTAALTALDIYALHCCWELECNGDQRTPEKRTVEAGLKLLRRYNPEL